MLLFISEKNPAGMILRDIKLISFKLRSLGKLGALIPGCEVVGDHVMTSLGKDLVKGLLEGFALDASCGSSHAADHGDRCISHVAQLGCDLGSVHRDELDIITCRLDLDQGRVDDQKSAGFELFLKLLHGRLIEADNNISIIYYRRSDRFIRDNNGTVCSTAAHLGTV